MKDSAEHIHIPAPVALSAQPSDYHIGCIHLILVDRDDEHSYRSYDDMFGVGFRIEVDGHNNRGRFLVHNHADDATVCVCRNSSKGNLEVPWIYELLIMIVLMMRAAHCRSTNPTFPSIVLPRRILPFIPSKSSLKPKIP